MAAADPPADPDRHEEAIKAFRKRVPITDPQYKVLTAAEKEHAFWVSEVTQLQPLQDVWDALDSAIANGDTLETFKAAAGDALETSWGGEDAPRVEVVFRSNVLGAYNAGRYEMYSDPVVAEARPYLRKEVCDDSRTCPICEPLRNVVLLADDPFWKTHTGSLHHQCRCTETALDHEEAHGEGVTTSIPDHEPPDEGFGRPPSKTDDRPNLDQFTPELRSILEDRLDE